MGNPFVEFVKEYREKNPNLSYKEAMVEASKVYKGGTGAKKRKVKTEDTPDDTTEDIKLSKSQRTKFIKKFKEIESRILEDIKRGTLQKESDDYKEFIRIGRILRGKSKSNAYAKSLNRVEKKLGTKTFAKAKASQAKKADKLNLKKAQQSAGVSKRGKIQGVKFDEDQQTNNRVRRKVGKMIREKIDKNESFDSEEIYKLALAEIEKEKILGKKVGKIDDAYGKHINRLKQRYSGASGFAKFTQEYATKNNMSFAQARGAVMAGRLHKNLMDEIVRAEAGKADDKKLNATLALLAPPAQIPFGGTAIDEKLKLLTPTQRTLRLKLVDLYDVINDKYKFFYSNYIHGDTNTAKALTRQIGEVERIQTKTQEAFLNDIVSRLENLRNNIRTVKGQMKADNKATIDKLQTFGTKIKGMDTQIATDKIKLATDAQKYQTDFDKVFPYQQYNTATKKAKLEKDNDDTFAAVYKQWEDIKKLNERRDQEIQEIMEYSGKGKTPNAGLAYLDDKKIEKEPYNIPEPQHYVPVEYTTPTPPPTPPTPMSGMTTPSTGATTPSTGASTPSTGASTPPAPPPPKPPTLTAAQIKKAFNDNARAVATAKGLKKYTNMDGKVTNIVIKGGRKKKSKPPKPPAPAPPPVKDEEDLQTKTEVDAYVKKYILLYFLEEFKTSVDALKKGDIQVGDLNNNFMDKIATNATQLKTGYGKTLEFNGKTPRPKNMKVWKKAVMDAYLTLQTKFVDTWDAEEAKLSGKTPKAKATKAVPTGYNYEEWMIYAGGLMGNNPEYANIMKNYVGDRKAVADDIRNISATYPKKVNIMEKIFQRQYDENGLSIRKADYASFTPKEKEDYDFEIIVRKDPQYANYLKRWTKARSFFYELIQELSKMDKKFSITGVDNDGNWEKKEIIAKPKDFGEYVNNLTSNKSIRELIKFASSNELGKALKTGALGDEFKSKSDVEQIVKNGMSQANIDSDSDLKRQFEIALDRLGDMFSKIPKGEKITGVDMMGQPIYSGGGGGAAASSKLDLINKTQPEIEKVINTVFKDEVYSNFNDLLDDFKGDVKDAGEVLLEVDALVGEYTDTDEAEVELEGEKYTKDDKFNTSASGYYQTNIRPDLQSQIADYISKGGSGAKTQPKGLLGMGFDFDDEKHLDNTVEHINKLYHIKVTGGNLHDFQHIHHIQKVGKMVADIKNKRLRHFVGGHLEQLVMGDLGSRHLDKVEHHLEHLSKIKTEGGSFNNHIDKVRSAGKMVADIKDRDTRHMYGKALEQIVLD